MVAVPRNQTALFTSKIHSGWQNGSPRRPRGIGWYCGRDINISIACLDGSPCARIGFSGANVSASGGPLDTSQPPSENPLKATNQRACLESESDLLAEATTSPWGHSPFHKPDLAPQVNPAGFHDDVDFAETAFEQTPVFGEFFGTNNAGRREVEAFRSRAPPEDWYETASSRLRGSRCGISRAR
jgi:hypothetical protein